MYLKLSDVPLEVYQELGIPEEAITGAIPTEDEFIEAVSKYYYKNRRRKDFDPIKFKELVTSMYYALKEKLQEGKVTEDLASKLELAKAKVSALEQLLEQRKNLIGQLSSRPEEAVKALLEEKALKKPMVTLPTGYETKGLIRKDPLQGLDDHIKILQTARKSDEAYKNALSFAKKVLINSLSRIQDDIKKAKQDLIKIEGKIKAVGTMPKTKIIEVKPIVNSPLVDPESLMKSLDQSFHVYQYKQEEAHPYAWLKKPDYLNRFFKILESVEPEKEDRPPAPGTLKYKTDIAEVYPKIMNLIGLLRAFAVNLHKEIKDIDSELKEESHMLSSITKEEFDTLKDIRKKLKERYGADFDKLVQYDPHLNDFTVPDNKLPNELKPVRERLRKLNAKIQDIRSKNKTIEGRWHPILKRVDGLKENLSKIRELYNTVAKEDYFRQWIRGDVPVELPVKTAYEITASSGSYLDPGKTLSTIRELVSELKKTVEEHSLTSGKTEDIRNLLKIGNVWEYLDYVQKTLTEISLKIKGYFESIDNFLVGIMTGRSLARGAEKTAQTDMLRHFATMLILSDVIDQPIPYRSELPVKLLRNINPDKPGVYYDYFQKSFPGEKIWNEWFKLSGGKTLEAHRFQPLIERLWSFAEPKEEDIKKLEEEKEKLESELSKLLAERKADFDKIDKARAWAVKITNELNDEFMRNKALSEASREKIRTLKENVEKMTESFIEALRAKDYEKCMELDDKITRIMNDIHKLIKINSKTMAEAARAEEDIGKARETWADVGMRLLNRISRSQDREYKLNNDIVSYEHQIKHGLTDRQKARIKKVLAHYVWNVLDENWSRDPAAFQTRFNLGFKDYMDIHEAVEKYIGSKVPSIAYSRIKKEVLDKINEYRMRKEPIPESLLKELEFLKGRGYSVKVALGSSREIIERFGTKIIRFIPMATRIAAVAPTEPIIDEKNLCFLLE